jgi:hypothetical protein
MLPSSQGKVLPHNLLQMILTAHSHIVTNPTSYIVTMGDHAAAKILALGPSTSAPATAGAVRN